VKVARTVREQIFLSRQGEGIEFHPAWPNDLLYMFPVTIFGTFALVIGLAVLDPGAIGEPANPFATPLEILRATRNYKLV